MECIHSLTVYTNVHICTFECAEREGAGERRERFSYAKQAFPDWDRTTVSHLIEFMNYLYPSILSGLS